MFQLVNSEDGEENEIGFDQLFFDDEDTKYLILLVKILKNFHQAQCH